MPPAGKVETLSLASPFLSGLTRGVRFGRISRGAYRVGRPAPRETTSMAYVIKRYSNRKLYDTQESRYVTLEEIEEMLRGGREISVVDAASGDDLTSVTLSQIILEHERNHRGTLPTSFLHQLIKHGEAWQ